MPLKLASPSLVEALDDQLDNGCAPALFPSDPSYEGFQTVGLTGGGSEKCGLAIYRATASFRKQDTRVTPRLRRGAGKTPDLTWVRTGRCVHSYR